MSRVSDRPRFAASAFWPSGRCRNADDHLSPGCGAVAGTEVWIARMEHSHGRARRAIFRHGPRLREGKSDFSREASDRFAVKLSSRVDAAFRHPEEGDVSESGVAVRRESRLR